MNISFYRQFILCVLLSVFTLNCFAATKAKILAIKISPSQTSSQIEFILNKKTDGDVHYYPKKKQVTVDFNQTEKNIHINNARLMKSNIQSISAKKMAGNKIRFTITVKQPINWKIKFSTNAKTGKASLTLTITNKKQVRQIKKTSMPVAVKKTVKPQKIKATVQAKRKDIVVVIDPGHGGKDSGAVGPTGRYEKDVVLAISKKLARRINRVPGMRAVLTRKGDYYVSLRKRLNLARHGDADVFIAVHADAFFNKKVRGASVYAISKRGSTSEAARWLAKQEHYSELDEIELNSLQDRSRLLRSVLIDLAQTATTRDSLRLGNKMLDQLDDISDLKKKKVEQAAFVVLKSPDIPSILIETGFISNPYEEKRLANPWYQEKLAQAICQGLKQYYRLS